MKVRSSRAAGFTLVEIMIVVAIIGLLAAIAVPNYVRARNNSQLTTCVNNLRQVDSAIQQYAVEQNQASSATVNYAAISAYLKRTVVCPSGGTTFSDSYSITDCQTKPTCLQISSTHVLPN